MPRFRTGTGRLSADMLNSIVRTDSQVQRGPAGMLDFRPRFYGPILCKVTDSQRHEGSGSTIARYSYTVREINMTRTTLPSIVFAEVSDGFSWTECLNVAEFDNTTTTSSGVAHADLPGTYELKPIPVGTVVDVFTSQTAETPYLFAWFNRPGEFDGSCESSSLAGETVLDTFTSSGASSNWIWRSANNWWNRLDAGSGAWSSTSSTTGTYLKIDNGSRISRSGIVFSAGDPGGWPTNARVRLTVTPSSGGVKTAIEGTPAGAGDSIWDWVDASGSTTTFTTAEIESGGTFGWDPSDTITIELFTPGS